MVKTREQKEQKVSELEEKLEKASSVVLADYHGISVSQMQELKRELKQVNAEFTVTKNTLLSRAAKGAEKDLPEENLKGPTAVLFSFGDPIESIKKLFGFIKKYGLPTVKSGLFEGRQLTKEEIATLSKIPGRSALYAKVVGSLNSPIFGLVSTLNGNLRNLVYVLNAIKVSNPPVGGSKGGA
ncbi:50S ribosomal protein L10 [Patescibacteria group bacterium]|nr:50S ribosomal protein L10 [Patescibacteria group bacterium]